MVKSKVLLNNFCFTKCSVYYIIDNKLDHSAYYTIDNKLDHSSEYQPDNFQDKLPKENHEQYGYPNKSSWCNLIQKWDVVNSSVLWAKSDFVSWRNTNRMFLLFYTYQYKKELLSGCPPFYWNKLLEPAVPFVVKNNKIKFESSGDLFCEAYSRYNANALDNQDTFGQIKKD